MTNDIEGMLRSALKACELLIKYDEGNQKDSVQLMFDYANAVDAARKAIKCANNLGKKP